MAKLIYSSLMSLDGYIEDSTGSFEWAAPDEQVHEFVNELSASIGTFLLGRKMYEVLSFWETAPTNDADEPEMSEFARIWQSADKVVYSNTLVEPSTERTRIATKFDEDEVRQLKASSDRDVAVGGPELAASAIRAGLVDEYQFIANPVIIGSGKRALPSDIRIDLALTESKQFDNGAVFTRYSPA